MVYNANFIIDFKKNVIKVVATVVHSLLYVTTFFSCYKFILFFFTFKQQMCKMIKNNLKFC